MAAMKRLLCAVLLAAAGCPGSTDSDGTSSDAPPVAALHDEITQCDPAWTAGTQQHLVSCQVGCAVKPSSSPCSGDLCLDPSKECDGYDPETKLTIHCAESFTEDGARGCCRLRDGAGLFDQIPTFFECP